MFSECVFWSECCGETQGPLGGWLRPLTAAVGEDEEVGAVYEREEVKGRGVLKKAGTELVKYHPWTKTVATTVVFAVCYSCPQITWATEQYTHINNLSNCVLFNFQCWRWCVCLLPPSLAYVISHRTYLILCGLMFQICAGQPSVLCPRLSPSVQKKQSQHLK